MSRKKFKDLTPSDVFIHPDTEGFCTIVDIHEHMVLTLMYRDHDDEDDNDYPAFMTRGFIYVGSTAEEGKRTLYSLPPNMEVEVYESSD